MIWIREMPTEITVGIKSSTEYSVAKQGIHKKILTDISV